MAKTRTLKYYVIRRTSIGDPRPLYYSWGGIWKFSLKDAIPYIAESHARRNIPVAFRDELTNVVHVREQL